MLPVGDQMKRFGLAIAALVFLSGAVSWTQTPAFEVASIKLHKGDVNFSQDPTVRGRTVQGTASTLLDLITYSYGVRYDQISGGPPWANADHFDIAAKSEGEGTLPAAQARQMFQALLASRFQLKVHMETTDVPEYALAVGKTGIKMKLAGPDAKPGGSTRGTDKGLRMDVTRGSMAQLARQLSNTAGRPVIDKTGLTGLYAYTLEWFPADRVPPADLIAPSMFSALQEQLGLHLESTRGPVEKLVIDHVEKPTEN
jgi:uncharacterized protein (TIGR03435 family)